MTIEKRRNFENVLRKDKIFKDIIVGERIFE
jgi:hypothetical protein